MANNRKTLLSINREYNKIKTQLYKKGVSYEKAQEIRKNYEFKRRVLKCSM